MKVSSDGLTCVKAKCFLTASEVEAFNRALVKFNEEAAGEGTKFTESEFLAVCLLRGLREELKGGLARENYF
jgi:hypothetical protein